jgi:hypothetical protein
VMLFDVQLLPSREIVPKMVTSVRGLQVFSTAGENKMAFYGFS